MQRLQNNGGWGYIGPANLLSLRTHSNARNSYVFLSLLRGSLDTPEVGGGTIASRDLSPLAPCTTRYPLLAIHYNIRTRHSSTAMGGQAVERRHDDRA